MRRQDRYLQPMAKYPDQRLPHSASLCIFAAIYRHTMKRFNLHSTIVRWISAIVVVLCFVVAAPARTWTPEEVPIPRLQDVRRYVSNPEGILSAATVDSLDRQLGALERDRGVQTLVVVVDRLKGNDPYRFAMTLARKYGVGNRETRTGLVVVLATGDRSYQFLTGNGLEGTLPDGLIQQIEDRIFLPRLRRGQWDEAMLAAMSAVDRACRNDGDLRVAKSSDDNGGTPWLLFLLLLGIPVGAYFYMRRLSQRAQICPRCGQKTLRRVGDSRVYLTRNGQRVPFRRVVLECSSCGYRDEKLFEDRDSDDSGLGAMGAAFLLGSLLRGGRSGNWGGGSSGGSYGGGSFGGGGSGGRF